MDEHGARICILLATLVNEIRELRADLGERSRRQRPRTLSDDDRTTLAVLLPAARQLFDDDRFTTGKLVRRLNKATRRAIDPNPMKLGRLFVRAADADESIGGLYVHEVGRSRAGVIFCVDAVDRESRMASRFAAEMRAKMTP